MSPSSAESSAVMFKEVSVSGLVWGPEQLLPSSIPPLLTYQETKKLFSLVWTNTASVKGAADPDPGQWISVCVQWRHDTGSEQSKLCLDLFVGWQLNKRRGRQGNIELWENTRRGGVFKLQFDLRKKLNWGGTGWKSHFFLEKREGEDRRATIPPEREESQGHSDRQFAYRPCFWIPALAYLISSCCNLTWHLFDPP